MAEMTAVILGGVRGGRLEPLTRMRAKPAIPIGGKFLLIDIPISNCIHSGMRQIYILTQYNTESLHRHIQKTYCFDSFSRSYIRLLAAQQTSENQDWYLGSADAVRKNLPYLINADEDILILPGDQLYRMDYREFYAYHKKMDADMTIAVKPVARHNTSDFGILKTDEAGWITHFMEKPKADEVLDEYKIETSLFENFNLNQYDRTHFASMGIYIFKKQVLFDLLNNHTGEEFGHHIIPGSINKKKIAAFFFDGYWEDVGTIKAFFNAHLELTQPVPRFNFYDEEYPFFTHARFLPASKIFNCQLHQAIIAEGGIFLGSIIEYSVVGIRAFIEEGTLVQRSIIMGNTCYETIEQRSRNNENGIPNLGVGNNCIIRNAIIDLDCRIGNNVQLINKDNKENDDGENYAIRDNIIIIPKGTVIPDNTLI